MMTLDSLFETTITDRRTDERTNERTDIAISRVAFATENNKNIDLLKFFVEITQKNYWKWHENVKTENDPWCVVKPQYLSFYLTKIQNQGQFWNPQDQ